MKKKFTFLIAAAVMLLSLIVQPMRAWAQDPDYTYTLANGDFTTSSHTKVSGGLSWTYTHGSGTESYGWDDTYGFKFGSSNSYYPTSFTLTSTSVSNNIKKVVVTASVNSKKSCKLDVTVGSTTYGSQVTINTKKNDEWEFSIDDESTVNGVVTLSFSTNTGPLYLKQIDIYYYNGGGGSGETTTTTISDAGITNTNLYVSTVAGSLSASVTYGEPAVAVPGAAVTWSGNNDAVATINASTGAITLVSAGIVTFTASYAGSAGEYNPSSDTYEMTVTNENPAITTIWNEDFSGYIADDVPSGGIYSYVCVDGNSATRIYEQNYAGGISPELLVGKSGGSFTATIPLGYCCSGSLTLTFKTNNTNIAVSSTTDGITVIGDIVSGDNTITLSGVTANMESIEINFANAETGNVRLDNIQLKGVVTIPVNGENVLTKDATIPLGTTCNVSTIIIPSIQTLTVNGILSVTTLTNNGSAANLIINDGGQVIVNNAGVQATFKKSVSHGAAKTAENWYTISSPVNNVAPGVVTNLIQATAANYDLYYYDEVYQMWRNHKANAIANLTNGKGYLYWNNTGAELSFPGELNSASVNIGVTVTGESDLSGFNLIGNPYSHNIYKGDGTAIPNSKTSDYVLSTGFYTLSNEGAWTAGTDNTTAIKPGQGILVKATAAGTVTMTNTTASSSAKRGDEFVKFTVANDKYEDVAYAMFNDEVGLNKINHLNEEVPMLSITKDNDDFAIATLDEAQGEMPVNFKAATDGTYTINVSTKDIEANYLHLIDNRTGMDIDLLQTPSYTFEASKSDYPSRFRLVFNASNTNESHNESENFGFISNGNLMILGIEGEATLQMIDVTGRVLSNETFYGNYNKAINAKAGLYMLRLIQGENVRTQKIVVK